MILHEKEKKNHILTPPPLKTPQKTNKHKKPSKKERKKKISKQHPEITFKECDCVGLIKC